MNFICTWLCADEKGEESIFPQTGQKSSSQSHQNIYWRCLTLFFATSKRFNKNEKHLLFTNAKHFPEVDGKKVIDLLTELEVEVIFTDFKYKTPKGYFGKFQNQFYEFSILEYITNTNKNAEDTYLILDSDCIFLRAANELFAEASGNGFLSFEYECPSDESINGLSRVDMKVLYEELLKKKITEIPSYHLGEFFLASVKNINLIFSAFLELWPEMLRRNSLGLPKFNEEAQTLSYLYYINGFRSSSKKTLMKRIWTNPVFFRNVEKNDTKVAIWHLPAEKQFGLEDLYNILINKRQDFGFALTDEQYRSLAQSTLGVPHLPISMRAKYYLLSYYRAMRKQATKQLERL